ncbi:hypothetical protein DF196_06695 [Bifidobacterium callitrichidarum]|uniref:Uncharacterized protein n=2 Tax=Bifidobacterium callitrichidarum TaxID=2052941 RepID=A0A2U2N9D2_9BIFI|nr:hypothetical protein DF196_06695 [Bifidobacterium callitrichidarum]
MIRESSATFTERTERTFGVDHLRCADDCPDYELPDDGTAVTWLKGDRLVHGTLVIDGTMVGLAGPDGTLMKPEDK